MTVRMPDPSALRPPRLAAPVAVGLLALSIGCADSAVDRGVTVTDSAGVEYVHSTRPLWKEDEGWRLSAEPTHSIGAVEGAQADLLDAVAGALRFDDRIAVALERDREIRFYDLDGRFLRAVGGRGEGPGEFQHLIGLHRLPGRVVGAQAPLLPQNVYDVRTGDFLGAMSLPDDPEIRSGGMAGLFPDSSMILVRHPSSSPPAGPVYTRDAVVFRADGATIDTVGAWPAVTYVHSAEWHADWQAFGPSLHFAFGADHWYHGYSATYEFKERTPAGELVRVVRRAWDPPPVTDVDRERYRASLAWWKGEDVPARRRKMAEQQREMLEEQRRRTYEAQTFPEHHPAFEELTADRAGNAWVRRTNPDEVDADVPRPTVWDVFDGSGRWLGAVEMPAGFEPTEIGADYVLGVHTDALDVEYVHMYALEKGDA